MADIPLQPSMSEPGEPGPPPIEVVQLAPSAWRGAYSHAMPDGREHFAALTFRGCQLRINSLPSARAAAAMADIMQLWAGLVAARRPAHPDGPFRLQLNFALRTYRPLLLSINACGVSPESLLAYCGQLQETGILALLEASAEFEEQRAVRQATWTAWLPQWAVACTAAGPGGQLPALHGVSSSLEASNAPCVPASMQQKLLRQQPPRLGQQQEAAVTEQGYNLSLAGDPSCIYCLPSVQSIGRLQPGCNVPIAARLPQPAAAHLPHRLSRSSSDNRENIIDVQLPVAPEQQEHSIHPLLRQKRPKVCGGTHASQSAARILQPLARNQQHSAVKKEKNKTHATCCVASANQNAEAEAAAVLAAIHTSPPPHISTKARQQVASCTQSAQQEVEHLRTALAAALQREKLAMACVQELQRALTSMLGRQ